MKNTFYTVEPIIVYNSLGSNKIGDESVVLLADALSSNVTVEQIQYVCEYYRHIIMLLDYLNVFMCTVSLTATSQVNLEKSVENY